MSSPPATSDPTAPGAALGFLGTEFPDDSGPVAAWDVLDDQQAAVHDAFREGFPTVRSLVEWCHAASAVSLGFVDDDWAGELVADWWAVAGLLSDPDRRDALSTSPPSSPSTVRETIVQRDLLPAFNSAIGLLRSKAVEHDERAVERHNAQRFLAMRPRVHQVAVAQHRLIREALGAATADEIETRRDVTRWARTVVQTTTGAVSSEWLETVTRPSGLWFALLTGDSGRVVLFRKLASELLPAMNAALHDAAKRAAPELEDARRGSGGPTQA